MTKFLHPELILHNARIHTFDDKLSIEEAMAIGHGLILALGTSESMESLAGPTTLRLDLGQLNVIPGITDSHIHLDKYARSIDSLDCENLSLESCLSLVSQRVKELEPGQWVLGHGWDQNQWERFGSNDDLDRAAPHHPVYLTAKSLHAAWVNSAALSLATIREESPDPPEGRIQRDPKGKPTGILLEDAMLLVSRIIPALSVREIADLIRSAQSSLWKVGVTSIHDFDGPGCLAALQVLKEENLLGMRVVKNIPVEYLENALQLGLRTGFGDSWIQIGNIKIFADGALGPRTAAMIEPYEGEPENFGMLLKDKEEIIELGITAAEGGLALAVHAIGDRANNQVLDALEALRLHERDSDLPPLPHRMEHLQLLHPDDIDRPAKLGIVASMQPIHAVSDMDMANKYWGSRVRHAYAWRSQLRYRSVLAFGSDAPVESPNPFMGIHAAVTRNRIDADSDSDGWVPQEKITLEEALRAYTQGPSRAVRMDSRSGAIKPGYLADLVVLREDPFQINPEELASIMPLGTMTGGEWRYRDF